MAVTATLLKATQHHLRYLVAQDGTAGTTLAIPNVGGATPDLGTDSLTAPGGASAPLATLIASAQASQAAARAALLNGGVGNAHARLHPRTVPAVIAAGDTAVFAVDANSAGGKANLLVTLPNKACDAILEIEYEHSIQG